MSEIDAAIGFTVGLLTVFLIFLVASELRGGPETRRQQQRVLLSFQDTLGKRLEEHQPRILVWLDNGDARLRPHALLEAHGYIYYVRSSADTAVMQDKAEEAAEYFAKKQLEEWMTND